MEKKDFRNLVFYEIYPSSFFDSNDDGIGDLKGIEEKLDYVKELGCNAIWLNPFYKSPFKDGGYDVSDFMDVDQKFGTLKDFDSLINKAHALGLKIIIDLVAGHASEKNPLFLQSAKDERNDCSDLFIWTSNIWEWEDKFRVVAGRHPRCGSYIVNFFNFQPAFNYGFNRVEKPWQLSYKDKRTFVAREYLLNVMRFWLKRGTDGFRVDMADSLVKHDDEKEATIELWQYFFSVIRKEFPDVYFVSEWSHPEKAFKAGFDADFILQHYNNCFTTFTKQNNKDELPVLKGGKVEKYIEDFTWRVQKSLQNNGFLALISGNHDTDRIASSLNNNELKTYYLYMLSMPGTPFIYYGDEIEMKHALIPTKDGGYQRTGDRTPMQWTNGKNKGFSNASELYLPVNNDNVSLENSLKDKNSLYYFIKKMIRIRLDTPELMEKKVSVKKEDGCLVYNRGQVKVYINISEKEKTIYGQLLISTSGNNTIQPFGGIVVRQ